MNQACIDQISLDYFRYTRVMRLMRTTLVLVMAVALCGPGSWKAFADEGPLDPAQPKGVTPEEIIQRFAAKEKEFKTALDQYGYRQTVKVQTVDGETVDGEYQQIFDVSFDDQGKKSKSVVFAPQSFAHPKGELFEPRTPQGRLRDCLRDRASP